MLPNYVKPANEHETIKACMLFDVIRGCNFPETIPVTTRICTEIEEQYSQKEKYINAILMNCINTCFSDTGFAVARDTHIWADFNRNRTQDMPKKVSVRSLTKSLDYMVKLGYLHCIKGKKAGINSAWSYTSCYFASDALRDELFDAWELFTKNDSRKPVVLRGTNKEDITPEVLPPEVQKRAEVVTSYNTEINKHLIKVEYASPIRRCRGKDADGKFIFDYERRELKRFGVKLQAIYNHDFNHGGRFYALNVAGISYQCMSHKTDYGKLDDRALDRSSITIDNQQTVEIDYSGLHINLAYAESGLQLDKDAYGWLKPGQREFAKVVTLIAINSTSKKQAIGAIYHSKYAKLHKIDYKTIEECLEKLSEYHQPLAEKLYKGRGYGLHLQWVDSCIMQDVLEKCLNAGIVTLPIHDSIIVKHTDSEQAKQIMVDAYRKVTKGKNISVK